jgi:cytochrome P450
LNEHQQAGRDDLDPQFLKDAVTQVKTMLVAGTATTADSVSFGAMLLSNYPEVVQKMRMEHDRVFAPGIDATYEILKTDPHRLNELVYTTDVIKEVLRLYPIGHTIRGGIDSITYQGRELPTKGLMVFLPSLATHMDPKNFPGTYIHSMSIFHV